MFTLKKLSPDAVFDLNTRYKADPNPQKINLGVGAYRTNQGQPWVLPVVRKAEKLVLEENLDHEYLPISGLEDFNRSAVKLVLGDHKVLAEGRNASVQCLSGTGALRTGGEYIKRAKPLSTVYVSEPTWILHHTLFKSCGLKVETYPYYNLETKSLDFEKLIEFLKDSEKGSVFVLHVCGHNPTGVDPSQSQWMQIAQIMKQKDLFPFFDSAYQGFATGNLENDSFAVRLFADMDMEFLISQSFAKNFGLYNERVGCLTAVCSSQNEAEAVHTHFCNITRNLVSNPPAHGARIVSKILQTPSLYNEWLDNLNTMVDRIKEIRKQLFDALKEHDTPGNWDHILNQIGMFSFTGLTEAQSKMMVEKFHCYMTLNGRISMCGLTTDNVQYFADCLDFVVRNCK